MKYRTSRTSATYTTMAVPEVSGEVLRSEPVLRAVGDEAVMGIRYGFYKPAVPACTSLLLYLSQFPGESNLLCKHPQNLE